MNSTVTSKEEILKKSRELLQQQGWSAINIRAVATACDVSVGSIYNYFSSKEELVAATVANVWCDIFHSSDDMAILRDILSCISWMYQQMDYGCKQYPEFFTLHSMSFLQEDTTDGKRRMQQTWQHILNGLCFVLKHDPNIRSDAFNEEFTPEKFADTLFSLMLSAFIRKDYDPSAILEIVRRALY